MISKRVLSALQKDTKKTKEYICNILDKYSNLEQLNNNRLVYNKEIFRSRSVNYISAYNQIRIRLYFIK